eukprot:GDKJ01016126.1.p1 GENE.GDKJ01016126.1~~GDKJ01016126.1.p1  ORF type:complete len:257 (+),score=84.37 GDKJ01016126.1:756-1526(+)
MGKEVDENEVLPPPSAAPFDFLCVPALSSKYSLCEQRSVQRLIRFLKAKAQVTSWPLLPVEERKKNCCLSVVVDEVVRRVRKYKKSHPDIFDEAVIELIKAARPDVEEDLLDASHPSSATEAFSVAAARFSAPNPNSTASLEQLFLTSQPPETPFSSQQQSRNLMEGSSSRPPVASLQPPVSPMGVSEESFGNGDGSTLPPLSSWATQQQPISNQKFVSSSQQVVLQSSSSGPPLSPSPNNANCPVISFSFFPKKI